MPSWSVLFCFFLIFALSLTMVAPPQVSKAGKKAVAVNAASAYSVGGGVRRHRFLCLAFSLRPWVRVWNWRDTTMAETEHVWIVFHSCEFPSGFTSILKWTTFPMIINDSMIPFFGLGENYVGHPGFQPRWWAVVDMRWRNPVASPAPYWRPCRKLNGCEAETKNTLSFGKERLSHLASEWGIQVECMGI